MEHDSSRSGYHEPEPGYSGLNEKEDWGDDFVKTFSVNLIWAQGYDKDGRSGAIGYRGSMPWHLSEDLKRFKELTVSHPIIMGRKTWQSLDPARRPLPKRDNIVVSRNEEFRAPGATVVDNLEDALDIARQEAIPDDGLDRSEIWVIGGSEIFEEMLPIATRAYVTQLDVEVDADAYAPDMTPLLNDGTWKIVDETGWLTPQKSSDVARFRFKIFERNQAHEDDIDEYEDRSEE